MVSCAMLVCSLGVKVSFLNALRKESFSLCLKNKLPWALGFGLCAELSYVMGGRERLEWINTQGGEQALPLPAIQGSPWRENAGSHWPDPSSHGLLLLSGLLSQAGGGCLPLARNWGSLSPLLMASSFLKLPVEKTWQVTSRNSKIMFGTHFTNYSI